MGEASALPADPLAALAQHLTAEAAHLCSSLEAALVVAAASCIAGANPLRVRRLPDALDRERRIVAPRGQAIELGGVAVLQLLRFAGALPVEVGTALRCDEGELGAALREGAAAGLCVMPGRAAALEAAGMARFVAACRQVLVPAIVLIAARASPLAALDAGADLVLFDAERCHDGPKAGVIACRRDLLPALALQDQGIGALFRPDPAMAERVLAAIAAAAEADPGMALAAPGSHRWPRTS